MSSKTLSALAVAGIAAAALTTAAMAEKKPQDAPGGAMMMTPFQFAARFLMPSALNTTPCSASQHVTAILQCMSPNTNRWDVAADVSRFILLLARPT